MLVQWLPQGLALIGALVFGAWGYRRLRHPRAGRMPSGEVLSLCLAVACLGASAATSALSRLDEVRKQQLSAHGPVTAADYHAAVPAGTAALDFTLPRLDNGQPVHLAEVVRRRPAVLVFGSFGCDYFCNRLDHVRRLQQQYMDRAEFLFVYIDNGHPEPQPLRAMVADAKAPSDAPVNRLARIRAGMRRFGVSFPCVIDTDDNRLQRAYDAWPARLVIVDRGCKVAFDSGGILSSGLNPVGAATWLEEHTQPAKRTLH